MKETAEIMKDIAKGVQSELPEGYGFFVLTFPLGGGKANRANYISNTLKEDSIECMKEIIERFEKEGK